MDVVVICNKWSWVILQFKCKFTLILELYLIANCSLRDDQVSMLTHTYPTQTHAEDWSGHVQSPGWQPILYEASVDLL